MISDSGHEVDALGHAGEEGRYKATKEYGELPNRALTRTCPNGETP